LGAFIKSTRRIGSCIPAVRQLVSETEGSTIGYHSNSCFLNTVCSITLPISYCLRNNMKVVLTYVAFIRENKLNSYSHKYTGLGMRTIDKVQIGFLILNILLKIQGLTAVDCIGLSLCLQNEMIDTSFVSQYRPSIRGIFSPCRWLCPSVRLLVCLSDVRLSHAGTVSKRLLIRLCNIVTGG